MDSVETSGKTIEEAVEAAARELGVTIDAVQYEVLDPGTKGFLGLGQSPVSIRATVGDGICRPAEHKTAEAGGSAVDPGALAGVDENTRLFVTTVMKTLQDCLSAMDMDAKPVLRAVSEEEIDVEIVGSDVAILIGHHGQTLDALEYLMQMAGLNAAECRRRFILDAEGYRERHKQMLMRTAREYAAEVKAQNSEAVLDPQPARERRIIHMALVDDPDVYTYSEGEGPDRHVVISPKSQ